MWVALFAVLMTAQAAKEEAGPRILGNPEQWFGRDAYPPEAVKANEQGRSVVRIEVGADGKPKACTVSVSSGSTALDEGTCAIAMSKILFAPARDARGKAVVSSYILPVRWQLEDGQGPFDVDSFPKESIFEREFVLDSQGNAMRCRVLQPPDRVGECHDFIAGTQMTPPVLRGGKPIGGTLTVRVHSRYVPDPVGTGEAKTPVAAPPPSPPPPK